MNDYSYYCLIPRPDSEDVEFLDFRLSLVYALGYSGFSWEPLPQSMIPLATLSLDQECSSGCCTLLRVMRSDGNVDQDRDFIIDKAYPSLKKALEEKLAMNLSTAHTITIKVGVTDISAAVICDNCDGIERIRFAFAPYTLSNTARDLAIKALPQYTSDGKLGSWYVDSQRIGHYGVPVKSPWWRRPKDQKL